MGASQSVVGRLPRSWVDDGTDKSEVKGKKSRTSMQRTRQRFVQQQQVLR